MGKLVAGLQTFSEMNVIENRLDRLVHCCNLFIFL